MRSRPSSVFGARLRPAAGAALGARSRAARTRSCASLTRHHRKIEIISGVLLISCRHLGSVGQLGVDPADLRLLLAPINRVPTSRALGQSERSSSGSSSASCAMSVRHSPRGATPAATIRRLDHFWLGGGVHLAAQGIGPELDVGSGCRKLIRAGQFCVPASARQASYWPTHTRSAGNAASTRPQLRSVDTAPEGALDVAVARASGSRGRELMRETLSGSGRPGRAGASRMRVPQAPPGR